LALEIPSTKKARRASLAVCGAGRFQEDLGKVRYWFLTVVS
jgi:hypothetical protein